MPTDQKDTALCIVTNCNERAKSDSNYCRSMIPYGLSLNGWAVGLKNYSANDATSRSGDASRCDSPSAAGGYFSPKISATSISRPGRSVVVTRSPCW